MANQKEKSSAYLMAALLAILMLVGMGTISAFGAVLYPISTDLNASIAAITVMSSLCTGVTFLGNMFVGKTMEKITPKKTLLIAVIVLGLHQIGYSFCTNIWQLYICAAFSGIGLAFLTVPAVVVLSQWFAAKKNTMISILFAGSSVGGFVFIALAGMMLPAVGWRGVYRWFGIATLVVGVIIVLIIKNSPLEIGQKPYGYDQVLDDGNGDAASAALNSGVDKAVAMKSACYWLICIACFLIVGVSYAVTNLGATALAIRGMDTTKASLFLSAVSAICMVGSVVSGIVTDKLGLKVYLIYAGVLAVIGVALFAAGSIAPLVLVIAAIVFGFANAIGGNIAPLILQACFGQKDFQALSGIPQGFLSLGGSILVIVISAIGTSWGWSAAYIAAGACTVTGIIIMFICLGITPLKKLTGTKGAEAK